MLQNGMTPLMQAAYKGKHEMCQLLIEKGANVNCTKHEQKVILSNLASMTLSHQQYLHETAEVNQFISFACT